MDTQLATITLGDALDLTASIKLMLTCLAPSVGSHCLISYVMLVLFYLVLTLGGLNFKLLLQQAEKNVALLSKLAKVVAQEKLLLEEFLELLRTISTLEVKYKH